MKLIKILPIVFLFSILGNAHPLLSSSQEKCDKIEVEVTITNSTNQQHNGKIQIDLIRGDRGSVKFIFCDSTGKVINEGEFKRESQENLKPGKYICIVTTVDCSKKIAFTIE
jgi:hypothetical protein